MADITALIERLVAAGADPVVAACVVAEAVVAGSASAPYREDDGKSKAAIRQARYRARKEQSVTERNENVTERNESVTGNDRNETSQNVTNHNENVTPLRCEKPPLTYFLPSEDNSEKKESKKERVSRKRNAPLRDDWAPSLRSYEVAEENGVNVQIVEQIFRDYLKSSGKLYADYDAAFNNFLRNQRKFNGNSHAKAENPKSGSLIAALDRALERSIAEDAALAAPENSILSFPGRSILGS